MVVFSVAVVCGNKGSGNILILSFPLQSYLYNTVYLANELNTYGYSVTVVLADGQNNEHVKDQFNIDIIFSMGLNKSLHIIESVTKTVVSNGFKGSILGLFSAVSQASKICQNIGTDNTFIKDLQKRQFDMVILNMGALNLCASVIPYQMSVPFIRQDVWINTIDTRSFVHPAVYPVNVFVSGRDSMSYTQRIGNTLFYLLHLFKPSIYNPSNVVESFAPHLTQLTNAELEANTELYLLSYDELIDFHFPIYPNMIPVGGLSTHPAADLMGELELFMNSAQDGAVIVSFGSIISSLPKDVRDKMVGAFRELAYLKVVFKLGDEIRIDGNMMFMPWIPQNDLLAHRNTKLFITHCGMNANFEAIYHAVPVVALPVCSDQYYNAGKMVNKGYGVELKVYDFTKDDLISAIEHVLGTPSYKENIYNASVIFKNRPETPAQRAAWWVDHVIKYGGKHLRPPVAGLPFYQYLMIDVIAGIIIMATVLWLTCYWTFKLVCKILCKMKPKRD